MGAITDVDWLDVLKRLLAKAGGSGDRRKVYAMVTPVYGRRRMIAYGENGRLSKKFFYRVCRDYSSADVFWEALGTWIQVAENETLTRQDKMWIAQVANKYIEEDF